MIFRRRVEGMHQYTIKKGKKDFRPLDGFMPVRLSDGYHEVWEVLFTDSCRYRVADPDQADWNKGGGITLNFMGRDTSGRWVWRYNPHTDHIELGAYYYVQGTRIVPRGPDGTEVQHSIPLATRTRIEMHREEGQSELGILFENGATVRQELPDWPVIGREMGLFFGGQDQHRKPSRAPRDMKILMNRIKIK